MIERTENKLKRGFGGGHLICINQSELIDAIASCGQSYEHFTIVKVIYNSNLRPIVTLTTVNNDRKVFK